jgi:bacterioferritin (cytochrome b1)
MIMSKWREEADEEIKRIPFEEYAQDKLDEYESKIEELEKQIELMKNCGNCKYNIGANMPCAKYKECEHNPQWEMRV